ncbi:DUF2628 domain-containing protein [Enterovirga aerilata]|uniref:DUF2628 domain-containing protein n=1 Tax=Enterovirga aerilata TaxID=2730920 RepID=A0A849HU50_9HYPH|nr:DUF2628 domain-containing protein [Enterovirga sp. DB1703]NNM71026.1 DUF2628 domain-containing protein [Enterovirga sp. DB1703]
MSSSFTVHLPKDALPGDPRALDRAEIVRDQFSWGAFLVPELWFLWHRHWIVAIGVLLVSLAVAMGLRALGFPAGVIFLIDLLIQLFLGFEAASIRRLAYRMRGRPMTGLVIAADEAEAEAKGFAQWLDAGVASAPTPAALVRVAPLVPRPVQEPVLGLFPDAEGRR